MGKKRRWAGGGGQGKGKRPAQGGFAAAKKRPCVLATCPANRGREAARELSNLLGEYGDDNGAAGGGAMDDAAADATAGGSIQDELAAEIAALKGAGSSGGGGGGGLRFETLQTGCHGVQMVYFKDDADVVALAKSIAAGVRSGDTGVRFLARLLPLRRTAHADQAGLGEILLPLLRRHFGAASLMPEGVAAVEETIRKARQQLASEKAEAAGEAGEDGEAGKAAAAADQGQAKVDGEAPAEEAAASAVAPEGKAEEAPKEAPEEGDGTGGEDADADADADAAVDVVDADATYVVQFKRRNHSVLRNEYTRGVVRSLLPPRHRVDYKKAQVVIVIEALAGIVGASVLRGGIAEYEALNLQKACLAATGVGSGAPAPAPAPDTDGGC